jgi:hypothetical protein
MNASLRRSITRTGFRALNRVVLPAAKKGLASPPRLGFGVVVLETVGRRSGLRREVPLLSARVGDTLVMSTVRNPSQWVENAAAAGSARVWVGGADRAGTASVRRGPLQVVRVDLDDDPDLTPALAS